MPDIFSLRARGLLDQLVSSNAFIEYAGVKLRLDDRIMSPRMLRVIGSGRFEKQEAKHLPKIIQPGEIVLEIGAGIGFISTIIARHPNTQKVISYEANPALIPHIEQTIALNVEDEGKHIVRNAVLMNGWEEDSVDFYVHRDFWASSLLPRDTCIRVEKVEVHDLNQTIRTIKPTLIVCDIEGAELELFRDADLAEVRAVYMEIHQKAVGGRGFVDIFNTMHRNGFHYDQCHSEGSVILFLRT